MYSKLSSLSLIFGVDKGKLKDALDRHEDLYDFIAREKRCSRQTVKYWAHGAMYSRDQRDLID